jgi:putative addiction module killer protein
MTEVIEYVRTNGQCPFRDWVDTLNNHAAAKVLTAVERMKQGNLRDYKTVGRGVSERRIDYGPGYRIYFGQDGDKLIVLVGRGSKSRQSRDI